MTGPRLAKPRPTVADQWRSYATRPPVARWTSRASLILGVVLGIIMVAATMAGVVLGGYAAWRWLAG